jgi:PhnB protein
MAALNPYLNFGGTCEAAFNFYKTVFGGEFSSFQRFNEVSSAGEHTADGNLIMHVTLPIGDGTVLMGSDRPSVMGPVTAGNNVHISVQTKGQAETERIFNGLTDGGEVLMPLQETFWSAAFGMLTDKFGIQWMVNSEH